MDINFKEIFNEVLTEAKAENLTPEELGKEIEKIGYKYFKNSKIESKYEQFLGGYSLAVRFHLLKKYPHGLELNDPVREIFSIDFNNNTIEINPLTKNIKVVSSEENKKYFAFERVKTPVRKKIAKNQDQVLKYFDTYFKKMKALIKENIDRIDTSSDPKFKI